MQTLKNTNTKEYKTAVFDYLLNAIETGEGETPTDKLSAFFNAFDGEYNHANNKKRYPNLQQRIEEYLRGLPSAIDLPYSNYDIIECAKELHGVKAIESKMEDKIIKGFFQHMAFKLIQLAGRHNYNLNNLY